MIPYLIIYVSLMMSRLMSPPFFYASYSSTESPSPLVPQSFFFPAHSLEDASLVPFSPLLLALPELLSYSSLDPPSSLSIKIPAVSSHSFSLPFAHPVFCLFYYCRDPTVIPPRWVIFDTSPAIDLAP